MSQVRINYLIIIMLIFCKSVPAFSQESFKLIQYPTSDQGQIEAAYFDAGADKVVIFAHGAVFNKESWYFLAEKFKSIGISSLSIDFRGYGKSKAGSTNERSLDILGAIDYAVQQNLSEIYIIGASMGGAAVLMALDGLEQPGVKKIVLLAPAGGPAVISSSIQKLFVVALEDRFYNGVINIYENSNSPKSLKTYQGNSHAQNLFSSEHSTDLINHIIEFVTQ